MGSIALYETKRGNTRQIEMRYRYLKYTKQEVEEFIEIATSLSRSSVFEYKIGDGNNSSLSWKNAVEDFHRTILKPISMNSKKDVNRCKKMMCLEKNPTAPTAWDTNIYFASSKNVLTEWKQKLWEVKDKWFKDQAMSCRVLTLPK